MSEPDMRVLQIQREIEEALQRTVKISHSEATRITAADLLSKYKGAKSRKQHEDVAALRHILTRYYLSEDEFEIYT
jgi:RNase H-fold protein (predicted Holliday junction resolvase)